MKQTLSSQRGKPPEFAAPVTQSARLEPSNSASAAALFYVGLNICECSHASCFHLMDKSFIKNEKICSVPSCVCIRYVPRQVIYPYTDQSNMTFYSTMQGVPRINDIPQGTDDPPPLPPVQVIPPMTPKNPYSL